MSDSTITRIVAGRAHDPHDLVLDGLSCLIERAGGIDRLRELVEECDEMPSRALGSAIRQSRRENMFSSVGESQIAFAVLMAIFWLIVDGGAYALSFGFLSCLFAPTVAAVVVHLVLQYFWSARWYRLTLGPALADHSPERSLAAALDFYRVTSRRMTVPGTLLYPITAVVTLTLIDAPTLAWICVIPVASASGWIVNQWLYATRLFSTDMCKVLDSFSVAISAEEREQICAARRGSGGYRIIWERFEARGYGDMSPFGVYMMAQLAYALISGLLVVGALVALNVAWQRLLVAVPIVPGISCIVYSYYLRFSFLHRCSGAARFFATKRAPPRGGGHTDLCVSECSQALRRAMP